MITVRALHDGIFAVSTISQDGEDDCPPPKQPSCRSCLCWISGKSYLCSECSQTYCNVQCAATERHKLCAGRQTALAALPSKESHQKRLASAAAYGERQVALTKARSDAGTQAKHVHKMQLQHAANKRWRDKKALAGAVASLDRERQ